MLISAQNVGNGPAFLLRSPATRATLGFPLRVRFDAVGYQGSAGTDYVAPEPEPAPVIKVNSAYGRLKKIAGELCAETPGMTASAAFVKVFTDPANREFAELSKRESAFA